MDIDATNLLASVPDGFIHERENEPIYSIIDALFDLDRDDEARLVNEGNAAMAFQTIVQAFQFIKTKRNGSQHLDLYLWNYTPAYSVLRHRQIPKNFFNFAFSPQIMVKKLELKFVASIMSDGHRVTMDIPFNFDIEHLKEYHIARALMHAWITAREVR